jgi:hypothetical protein
MVELGVTFAAPERIETTSHKGPTNYLVHGKTTFEHAYIKATSHGRDVKYLPVLCPRKLSEPVPEVASIGEGVPHHQAGRFRVKGGRHAAH